ncbi:MAG: tyrosine-type recombinase/integrase [Bacteroidales bacterium]|nr:tyrosine-type recombinase/integrase [Bacteroidales bacterium]MCM1417056.1 tyrosine-type recombinase/integrase [bacterium]MCM1424129.1 tyrosine-type recombinase/integrase [bacterium]
MNTKTCIKDYLNYCDTQKCLDPKTLKAYRIDLRQFCEQIPECRITEITSESLERYIARLHAEYRPRTAKRKIASVKALFHYLEYRELLEKNPFNRIRVRFREPLILPKTIPLRTVELFLSTIYRQHATAPTPCQKQTTLRDAAVAELLFATGMRISELCSLRAGDVNLSDGTILIYGKGSRERRLQIGSDAVLSVLAEYDESVRAKRQPLGYFFVNRSGDALSDQSVRRMINKYTALASIEQHITPHMFRHTFATSLLDADVDIRCIQEMLGHSSINITEIYTHVSVAKQRNILATKHPRKDFRV